MLQAARAYAAGKTKYKRDINKTISLKKTTKVTIVFFVVQ